jgi:hypothetical protein
MAAGGTTPQITLATTGAVTLTGALNGTSASFAINNASVGNATNLNLQQAGSGDVAVSYLLTGTREWLVGVDNSDSDAFKINNITGSSDFNNTGLSIATTGAATFSSSVTASRLTASNSTDLLLNLERTAVGAWGFNVTSGGNLFLNNRFGTNVFQIADLGAATFSGALNGTTASFAGTGRAFQVLSSDDGVPASFRSTLGSISTIGFRGTTSANDFNVRVGADGNDFIAYTNNTERMRINSDGNLLVGTTDGDPSGSGTQGIAVRGDGILVVGKNGAYAADFGRNTNDGELVRFRRSATAVGSISVTTSATAYNTSSDYRLKEDLQEIKGIEKVSALKVYDFKWKDSENRMDGVLAHELAEVLPYAVHGEKDAVDEEGNDKMQGVDYSKIVPILIKAIQELKTEIDSLKTK